MIETLKAGLLLKTDKGMNTDKSHEIWTGVTGPVLILGKESPPSANHDSNEYKTFYV